MKLKNKQTQTAKDKLIERMVFSQMFDRMIVEEKSDFGKMVLMHNLIAIRIIGLFHRLDLYYNVKLKKENYGVNISSSSRKFIEDYSFGRLIQTLELFLSENSHPFIIELKKYSKIRNNITHGIFSGKYKNIVDLFADAKKAVKSGEVILEAIESLQEGLLQEVQND